MPNHDEIYQTEAERYDRMISKQPQLREFIESIIPITGKDIVDLGTGTGRLTCELAPMARSIVSLDSSESMLMKLSRKLQEMGLMNWLTFVADHQLLPLPNKSADLILAGWTICYLASSNHKEWQQSLDQIMQELRRVLRPDGVIIIFETMGTGYTEPNPPAFLTEYYSQLEEKYGFHHKIIPFDYQFESVEEAEELTRFFFGDDLANRVIENQWRRVPEFAGVWWLTI